MSHLISPRELQGEWESGRPVRLLDVRWRLDVPEGRPDYVAGHLPGAVYVDLERELSRRGYPEDGRYPLPELAELEASVRRWGVRDGDFVVAYDDNDAVAAARAWWLLRRRGVQIRVLDGGLRAWVAQGFPLERGDHAPAPGNATLTDVDPGAVTMDEAARAPVEGYLIDVRAPEHYRGLTAGLDPVAGHIPGALNIPVIAHIARDGTFRPPEEIRAVLDAFGVDPERPITLYCGAGISSAHSALAYAQAGIETQIYPGSWSQWARSPRRPVAVGRTPADALHAW
ncbi:sulfurtransferase [Microbacterium sp. SS28]|uniref:sulfurtransferase n=1 Tax=Microbacterium sp. SS28 TaxID=2919948 RepID=UPI001FAA666E|nr:sulfurtransferase [Microbacterium sp. SS28]